MKIKRKTMGEIIIYHGSTGIIEKPVFGAGKKYNDYGRGFYCTENSELAKEWGASEGIDGFSNRYALEMDSLSVLDLSSEEFTILNWLAILMDNRIGRLSSPIEKRGREYLLQNFLPDYRKYDVIIGYRADDSYFSFARAFVSNTISLSQLEYAMKLGKLGKQIVLISEKAFDHIRFLDYTISDSSIYYAKKKVRDEQARADYIKALERDDIDGLYMRDIIQKGMRQDD